MDDEAPRLVYNPDDGSIELRTGARGVTVDGLDAEVVFERMTPEGDAASPLWLAPAEADVLRKMIGYIIDKVRITEGSKGTLAELLPRVQAIADAATAGAEGSGSGSTSGPAPSPGGSPGDGGSRGAGGGFGAGGGSGSGRVVSFDRAQGSSAGRAPRNDDPPAPTDPLNVPGVRRGMPPPRDDDRDDEDDES